MILYKYIKGDCYEDIAYELQIDRHTASEYADLVREVICIYIDMNPIIVGGLNEDGTKKIVEID